ncbi:MAG: WD40 repeat domain-containing serine/threonine-protein kinase [Pirellulaceae bacterium]
MADAVAYAHARGVIHRDLKTGQCLARLTRPTPHHRLWLGQADGSPGSGRTDHHWSDSGYPAYMPPEQASGDVANVGTHSDVYSLGAMLYAMLTGKPPHTGANPIETLRQVMADEPASVRSINAQVPRDLETICLKCLAKAPDRRYSSAGMLAAELRRYLAGEPIEARPVGRWERAYRWSTRHPAASLAILLGAVLLALLAVGGPTIAWRQSALREEAETSAQAATTQAELAQQAAARERAALRESEQARADLLAASERAHEELVARTVSQAYQSRTPAGIGVGSLGAVAPDDRGWDWDFVSRLAAGSQFTLRGMSVEPFLLALSREQGRVLAAGSPLGEGSRGWFVWQLVNSQGTATSQKRALAIRRDGSWLATTLPEGQDGSRIAVALDAGQFQITDADTEKVVQQFPGHRGGTVFASIADDAPRVATVGRDRRTLVWEIGRGEPVAEWEQPDRQRLHTVGLSPSGRWCAWVRTDDKVLEWRNVDDDSLAPREVPLRDQDPMAASPVFSADDRWLVVGADRRVLVFDVETAELTKVIHGHDGDVIAVDVSSDGTRIASASTDGTIRLWDMRSSREWAVLRGHTHGAGFGVMGVRFDATGDWLVSGGADRTVRLWDAWCGDREATRNDDSSLSAQGPHPTRELSWIVGHRQRVPALAWSPDHTSIATVSTDGFLRLTPVDSPPGPRRPRLLAMRMRWFPRRDSTHTRLGYHPHSVTISPRSRTVPMESGLRWGRVVSMTSIRVK